MRSSAGENGEAVQKLFSVILNAVKNLFSHISSGDSSSTLGGFRLNVNNFWTASPFSPANLRGIIFPFSLSTFPSLHG